MFNRDFFILAGIFTLVVFIVLGFFFPLEEKRRKKQKKKKLEEELSQEDKQWKETATGLKERITILKQEMASFHQEQEKLEGLLRQEKDRNADLEEKLKREKKWFSEQDSSLARRAQDIRQIKMDLVRLQTDREREYSLRLAAERDQRILKEDLDKINKEKKDLILEVTQLEFTIRTQKEDIVDLKKANADLSKKQEQAGQWIAKAEFQKLEQQLRDKEKEIEKLKQDFRRSA